MFQLRTISLLGGSFNPAHTGHVYISQMALKMLSIQEVWWLVSPQNPLKSSEDMTPFKLRLAQTKDLATRYKCIVVSEIEGKLKTCYSVNTIIYLRKRYPHYRFIWLMGADNLTQISHWNSWTRLFRLLPVAVYARFPYSLNALVGRAAQHFAYWRISSSQARHILTKRIPPVWVFLRGPTHPGSSTQIRSSINIRDKV